MLAWRFAHVPFLIITLCRAVDAQGMRASEKLLEAAMNERGDAIDVIRAQRQELLMESGQGEATTEESTVLRDSSTATLTRAHDSEDVLDVVEKLNPQGDYVDRDVSTLSSLPHTHTHTHTLTHTRTHTHTHTNTHTHTHTHTHTRDSSLPLKRRTTTRWRLL
jgi:hypothetical protein